MASEPKRKDNLRRNKSKKNGSSGTRRSGRRRKTVRATATKSTTEPIAFVILRSGGWAVKDSKTGQHSEVFKSKSLAIDAAQQLAQERGGKVLVYGLHGQIFYPTDAPSSIDEATIRRVIRNARTRSTESPPKEVASKESTSKRVGKKRAAKKSAEKLKVKSIRP